LEFQDAVKAHSAERHARGFSSWGQFIAMLFCQLGHAKSLREICGGLAASEGKLRHLGLPEAPSRSTLAYANEHRPWQLYQTVFHQLLDRCQAVAKGQKKFRFKNKLMSLDATVIDLCAEVFDWARFRQTKGAVKLHLLLDHDGYLPAFAVITEGKTHEIRVARQMRFEPDTLLVFDRGYTDYPVVRGADGQGRVVCNTAEGQGGLRCGGRTRTAGPPWRGQVRSDHLSLQAGAVWAERLFSAAN
jgi:hypothetical protein